MKAKKAEVDTQAATVGVGRLKYLVTLRLSVLGLTRADICTKETGLSTGRLSLWLIQGIDKMTVRSLRKLAEALRTKPAVLLDEGPGVPKELLKA